MTLRLGRVTPFPKPPWNLLVSSRDGPPGCGDHPACGPQEPLPALRMGPAYPGGAGSAPGRAASGLRRRRSLCWGSEHGGCGRAGGALLRWDPPRWDRGDSSVCPSLHPPPLVTASSFSKSVSVSSVSPSGSDVSDTRRCLSSSV